MTRPNFQDLQYVRPADFRDWQLYLLERQRRHARSQHLPGVVRGLELNRNGSGAPQVTAGFAIDGLGRQLDLTRDQTLDLRQFELKGVSTLSVFLVYRRRPFLQGRGTGMDPAGLPNAWDEEPEVQLLKSDDSPATPNPVDPAENDDPAKAARVLLGEIARSQGPDGWEYELRPEVRQNCGIIASTVALPPTPDTPEPRTRLLIEQGKCSLLGPPSANPVFSVDSAGLSVAGKLSVGGAVELGAGGLRLPSPNAVEDSAAIGGAKPSLSYRKIKTAQNQVIEDHLVLDLANGSSAVKLAIGFTNEDGEFQTILSVDSGNVKIFGDLTITGSLDAVEHAQLGRLHPSEELRLLLAGLFVSPPPIT